MNRAVIIGHHLNGKGAYSEYFKMYEYDFYMSMISELKCSFDVYLHNSEISSYTQRMKAMASRINGKGYDLALALHFNAFNGVANGCEALYTKDSERSLGAKFTYLINEEMKLYDRGAKKIIKGQRGFHEIAHLDCNALILEPFFGDNPLDCMKFDQGKFMEIIQQL